MSITIRCPKCGAGEDVIRTEQRVVLHGGLADYARNGKVVVENHDSEKAGPVWVICDEYMGGCGYRTKSLSVKTWTQEVDA